VYGTGLALVPAVVDVISIYLLTAAGLTPGGSSTVHIYTQTVHRTTQSTQRTTQLSIEQHKHSPTQLSIEQQIKHRTTQLSTEQQIKRRTTQT